MTRQDHASDIERLPLTDREKEICREALDLAWAGINPTYVYVKLFGVLRSAVARLRREHEDENGTGRVGL